jgi:hypothetical protein
MLSPHCWRISTECRFVWNSMSRWWPHTVYTIWKCFDDYFGILFQHYQHTGDNFLAHCWFIAATQIRTIEPCCQEGVNMVCMKHSTVFPARNLILWLQSRNAVMLCLHCCEALSQCRFIRSQLPVATNHGDVATTLPILLWWLAHSTPGHRLQEHQLCAPITQHYLGNHWPKPKSLSAKGGEHSAPFACTVLTRDSGDTFGSAATTGGLLFYSCILFSVDFFFRCQRKMFAR